MNLKIFFQIKCKDHTYYRVMSQAMRQNFIL